MDSLIYHSIFTSIQGEGLFTGKYSLFLRLAGCNLNCVFCDTKSAVDIRYFKNWKNETVNDIIEKIQKLSDNKIGNLIITGGEPLIQIKGLESLISLVKNGFQTIEIETNGTISGTPLVKHSVYFNVSVKLKNSGEKASKRIIPEIIREYNNYERAIFKFVVKSESDISEIIELKEEFDIPNQKIYLMPMATNLSELNKTGDKILKSAMKHSFNFSDRLQLRYNIK